MLQRIIWSAVLAVIFAAASVVSAVFGHEPLTLACGACAVTAAVLSNRER